MQKIIASSKGFITGFAMIALSLFFFYGLKQPLESSYQYVIYLTYMAGIVWTIFVFNKSINKPTSFKNYFSEGFKTFIVVTLLMVIYTVIFYKINPQILETKIQLNNSFAVAEGNHTPIEIEANAQQMRKVFLPMTIAITTFIYLFLGAIITAVTTVIFVQTKK